MGKGDLFIETKSGVLKRVKGKTNTNYGIIGIFILLVIVALIIKIGINLLLILYPILILGLFAGLFKNNKFLTFVPASASLIYFRFNLNNPPEILFDYIRLHYSNFFWFNFSLIALVMFFYLFELTPNRNSVVINKADATKSRIVTTLVLSVLFIVLLFTTVEMADPSPSDIPPVKTETTLEELELEELVVESGGMGGGTPSNDPIAEPRPQTERVLTQRTNPNNASSSGQSRHNTAPNSNETSSSTQASSNPFGSGGDGGGRGSGSGPGPFGNDQGSGGNGPGGRGNGDGRVRLNDPKVDHIETNVNIQVHLKLTVNDDGQVISASSTSKTTTTDQRIINQVIAAVKNQVRYNKDPGAGLVSMFLTVKVNAT